MTVGPRAKRSNAGWAADDSLGVGDRDAREHRLLARAGGWGITAEQAAFTVHVLTLVVVFGALLAVSRGQWFVGDDWDFIADRSLDEPRDLFVPHNEHWSTLPIIVYRLLYAAVGVHTYMPYLAVGFLVHLGVAHLLWRLLRRAGTDPWIAVAASGLFGVFGAGAENFLTAFGMTFAASVLFGLGHVLLVDHPRGLDRRDAAGVGLALAALLSSGIGITMVAVAGATALLRRGWRAALVAAGPPAIAFTVWFAVIGRFGLATHGGHFDGRHVPRFVWWGIAATVERTVGVVGASVVVIGALIVWLLARRGSLRGRLAAPLACLLGVVAFFAIAGAGRAGLALGFAQSSRYLYIAGALMLPAMGFGLSELARRRTATRAAAVVLLAVFAVNGWRLIVLRAEKDAILEQQLRRIILAAAYIGLPPSDALAPLPEPRHTPNLGYDELLMMHDAGKLPPPVGVGRPDELAALEALQITVSPSARLPAAGPASRPLVADATHLRAERAGDGCLQLEPLSAQARLIVELRSPVSIPIRGQNGFLQVSYRDEGGTIAALPLPLRLGEEPAFLNVNLGVGAVVVAPPDDGGMRLCGLG